MKKRLFFFFLLLFILSAFMGCGNSTKSGETLTILNYGKYFDPDALKLFEEETGIRVEYEEYESPEEMYTKYKAGSIDYDLLCTSDYMIQKLIGEGEVLEMNFDNIPDYQNINQSIIDAGSKKRLSNPYSNFTNGKIPDPYYNLQKTLNDRWKKPGDELHTIIPALYTSGDPIKEPLTLKLPNGLENVNRYDMWALSDAMVASGNFLRCNMINASYSLPSHLLSKFGAQSLQFTATMSNVFFIASKRWNGFDPELGNGTHPHVYTVGINLGF